MSDRPKAMVSGCYDLLHGGHVVFFETAARYGDLYVCVGADENVKLLKGNAPRFTQQERRYLVGSVKFVHEARVSSGGGMLDFEPDLREVRPDYFVVNEDGHTDGKKRLCESLGVTYVVLPRVPKEGLPARSSSQLKKDIASDAKTLDATKSAIATKSADATHTDVGIKLETVLPYRLCLAGGWLDQPFVSKFHAGPVVTVNIHPTRRFNLRSGLATSTRQKWENIAALRLDDEVELARVLFGYENPPGTKYVAGSQDAIGLCLRGVARLQYEGGYWPATIDRILDADTGKWLDGVIKLVEFAERPPGYDPLVRQNITTAGVKQLADAGEACWQGIMRKDARLLGQALTATHDAWRDLLPLTTSPQIDAWLDSFDCLGRVTTGCGGGYAIVISEGPVPGSFPIECRMR